MCCRTTAIVVTFMLINGLVRRGTGKGASATVHGLVKLRPQATHIIGSNERRSVLVTRLRINSGIDIHPNRRVPISKIVIKKGAFVSRDVVDNRPVPMRGGRNSGILTNAVGRGNTFAVATRGIKGGAILTRVVHVIRRTRKSGTPIRHVISGIATIFIPIILTITIFAFLI